MSSGTWFCDYCGVQPAPTVLLRADDAPIDPGGLLASAGAADHAEDCPYFIAPRMSRDADRSGRYSLDLR